MQSTQPAINKHPLPGSTATRENTHGENPALAKRTNHGTQKKNAPIKLHIVPHKPSKVKEKHSELEIQKLRTKIDDKVEERK